MMHAVYARVKSMLGDCRVMLTCEDAAERIGEIRGALRNKVYLNVVSSRAIEAET
jgi:initiation factor 1A